MNVTGDSMVRLNIHEGDLLLVDSSINTRPGHILVAMVDSTVTVKRYELLGDRPHLCLSNTRYAPVPLKNLDCQV